MKNSHYFYLSLTTIFVLLIQLMSPALVYADGETPPLPTEAPIETSAPEVTEAPSEIPATEPPAADPSVSTPEPTELTAESPSGASAPPAYEIGPAEPVSQTVEPVDIATIVPTEPGGAVEATTPPLAADTQIPAESPTPDALLNSPIAATQVPAEVAERSSDAPTAEPVESSTATPEVTETPANSTTQEASTLLEVQQATSDSTSIVVLDESGQPLPLVTQEAAEVIANGDPMWCPDGVAPGGTGCTASYSSLALLLSDLSAMNTNTGVAANGTIWIESSYNSLINDPFSTDFTLDGSTLTSWANYALTLQGGWDGTNGSTATPGPNSIFTVPIQILNWNNNVNISNITSTSGVTISGNNTGDVTIDNVSARNLGIATHNSGHTIRISNSDFSGNPSGDGAYIDGWLNALIIESTHFDNNAGRGLLEFNSWGGITISNTTFNQNGSDGANLNPFGGAAVIIDNNSTFNENGGSGLVISQAGDVTIKDSTYNNNLFHGIYISNTTGTIALENITATASASTYGDGAYIDNTWGAGDVTLSGINDFSNHSSANSGMFILSNGNVSLDGITSNNNGRGVNISQATNVTISNGTFSDNCCNYEGTGAYIFADGDVSINQSIFTRNSLYVNTIGDVAVDNVTIDSSPGFGLGVESFGGDVTINNSSFTHTVANGNTPLYPWGDGADIFFYYGGKVTVTQSHFTGNAFDGLYVDYPVDTPGEVAVHQSHFNNNQVGGLDIYNGNSIDIRASEFTTNAPNYDLLASCYTGISPAFFRDLSLIFDDSSNPKFPALIDIFVDKNCDYSNYSLKVGNTISTAPPMIGKERIAKNQIVSNGRNFRTLAYRGKAEFWLNCGEQYNFKVNLPNGDRVDIYCPVSGKAMITRLDNTTLPAELPTGYTFASAFDVEVLQPSMPLTRDPLSHDYVRTPISVIKEGGHIMASFVAPPLQAGKTFSILYWDNDSSQWIPLKDFLYGRVFKLFPDLPNDQREILSGVLPNSKISPDRVQVSTNFPGTFVLAQH